MWYGSNCAIVVTGLLVTHDNKVWRLGRLLNVKLFVLFLIQSTAFDEHAERVSLGS